MQTSYRTLVLVQRSLQTVLGVDTVVVLLKIPGIPVESLEES